MVSPLALGEPLRFHSPGRHPPRGRIQQESTQRAQTSALAGIRQDLEAMKVGDVRGCLGSIAQAANQDPDGLLEAATETARLEALGAKAKAERIEGEIDFMRRERLLPDEKTLEKISRYEAHLSRQLFHALHELENLQKHRTTGEGVPLARVDVQGLPDS